MRGLPYRDVALGSALAASNIAVCRVSEEMVQGGDGIGVLVSPARVAHRRGRRIATLPGCGSSLQFRTTIIAGVSRRSL